MLNISYITAYFMMKFFFHIPILIYCLLSKSVYCNMITNLHDYCVTKVCTKVAGIIVKNLDEAADPCGDFFQYACGNWVKENPLPQGVHLHTIFDQLAKQTQRAWTMSLTDETKAYVGPIKLAKSIMQACLKENEQIIQDSLLEYMKNNGGMPLIHDVDHQTVYDCQNPSRLSAILAASHQLSYYSTTPPKLKQVNPFFNLSPKYTTDNNYTLMISVPMYPQIYDNIDPVLTNMAKALINVLTGSSQQTQAQQDDIVHLTRFATIISTATAPLIPTWFAKNPNVTTRTMSLKEFATMISFLDWYKFLEAIFPTNMKDYIRSDDTKIVTTSGDITVLKAFNDYVLNATPNECRAIYNHIWFSTIFGIATTPMAVSITALHLNKRIHSIFSNSMLSQTQSRESMCAYMLIVGHLHMAVGALYVQEHFSNPSGRSDLQDMVSHIQTEFLEVIQEAGWLDKQTRNEAIKKAKMMRSILGYPDMAEQQNSDLLQKYYAQLSFNSDMTLFEMIKVTNTWALRKSFVMLIHASHKLEWPSSPAMLNAQYKRETNSIIITAGILNPPLFYADGPKSVNYGGIGVIIGHEITHGFDSRGRNFDENGEIRDWWQTISENKFLNRSACFVDQFGDIGTDYVNVTLDGRGTLAENIADAGGIKVAYKAYQKYIQRNSKVELRLPGLMHLSHNQLFFISTAQGWCGTFNKKGLMQQIKRNPHAVTKYRVALTMTNSEYFHKAFQCEKGTPMNPQNKCQVWLL